MPLYLIFFARLLRILVKYALNLFTISDLSVTIKLESIKYLGNVLFVLCLDSISLIIVHVFLYQI